MSAIKVEKCLPAEIEEVVPHKDTKRKALTEESEKLIFGWKTDKYKNL